MIKSFTQKRHKTMIRKNFKHSLLVRLVSLVLSVFLWISCVSFVFAENYPSQQKQVLMIVGFDGNVWQPYTLLLPQKRGIKWRDWQKIHAIVDPISVTRQPGTGNVFVKDNSGVIQEFSKVEERFSPLQNQSEQKGASSYTQLRAHNAGLVMVQLLMGKSRDTQLINYNNQNSDQSTSPYRPLVKQASGQFNPLLDKNNLFYGHVSCRLACDPVIQEIWQQNLITHQAQQLTLLNATSYLHSLDDSGVFGFISSNQHGYYHLARLNIKTKELTWLTSGQLTDSFPSIASNGDLYFIRRTPLGTYLMKLKDATTLSVHTDDHTLAPVMLPKGVQKIRYLELSTQ